MAAKRKTPVCDRCAQELSVYGLSYSHSKGHLPTLYGGVICTKCGHVECLRCKNAPPEHPCSWCGFPVVPADEDEFAAREKSKSGMKRSGFDFFMGREWAQGVLLAGLLVTLLVLGIPHYQEYRPALAGIVHAIFYAKSPVDVEDPTKYFISRPYSPPSRPPRDDHPAEDKLLDGQSSGKGKAAISTDYPLEPGAHLYPGVSPGEESSPAGNVFQSLVGEWVRVTLKDNRVIEGFVTQVRDGVIHVGRNYLTGAFSFSFTGDEVLTYTVYPLDQS